MATSSDRARWHRARIRDLNAAIEKHLHNPSADSAYAAAQQVVRNFQNRPTYRIEIRSLARLLKGENAVAHAKQIAKSSLPKEEKIRQIRKLLDDPDF